MMMGKKNPIDKFQMEMLCLDSLVPDEHLVRKLEKAIDLSFIYERYICPNNEVLKYTTTNREGYKEYKSNPIKSKDCPYLLQCTESKNHVKLVCRHVWEEYIEQAEDIRHTTGSKELYSLRSQTIERVFADAKELHGMRYAKHRGLDRMKMELNLLFACMNLKKLANRLWKNGLNTLLSCLIELIFEVFEEIYYKIEIVS